MATHHEYTDPYKMPLGELLALTETDATPQAELGYEYAKIALERTRDPKELTNPENTIKLVVAEARAARQAGIRGAQAGEDPAIVGHFFFDSHVALSTKKLPKEYASEEIETYVEAGRAEMLLKSGNPRRRFRAADRLITTGHKPDEPWDRIATINDTLWATYEAMEGDHHAGARLALRGLYRARHAATENDTPEKHKKFVRKYRRLNVLAGMLAISRVINFGPIRALREKCAARIVRGPKKQTN